MSRVPLKFVSWFSKITMFLFIYVGHGADVKCVGWHPSKCLVASGSKDSQQPLKLWDPRSASSLATMYDFLFIY